jgi:hypothetical protein
MLTGVFWKAYGVIAATIAIATLAGCASDPRYNQGVDWGASNEREKARLQAQGFPQYEDN